MNIAEKTKDFIHPFATEIINSSTNKTSNPFFKDSEEVLLSLLCMYVVQTTTAFHFDDFIKELKKVLDRIDSTTALIELPKTLSDDTRDSRIKELWRNNSLLSVIQGTKEQNDHLLYTTLVGVKLRVKYVYENEIR